MRDRNLLRRCYGKRNAACRDVLGTVGFDQVKVFLLLGFRDEKGIHSFSGRESHTFHMSSLIAQYNSIVPVFICFKARY